MIEESSKGNEDGASSVVGVCKGSAEDGHVCNWGGLVKTAESKSNKHHAARVWNMKQRCRLSNLLCPGEVLSSA